MTKHMGAFFDRDRMIGRDFETGLAMLNKTLSEEQDLPPTRRRTA